MALSPTTTAIAYKAALLANIKANTNIIAAKVQVSSTFPGDTLTPQAVYFGKTSTKNSIPILRGQARIVRQEEYSVEIHIDISSGQSLLDAAEATALGILGEIDNSLAANALQGQGPTQGQNGSNTFVFSSYVSDWVSRPYFDDARQGWAVLVTATIEVKARLA